MSEDKLRLIAVDCGRSSVKTVYTDLDGNLQRDIFLSKYGDANFNFLKNIQTITFSKKNDLICQCDNLDIEVLGDTCDKLLAPVKIKYCIDDKVYLEQSVIYTLASIGKIVDNDDKVVVAINLTFQNMKQYATTLRKQLQGYHKVIYYDTKGNVVSEKVFNIVELAIFYQGWSSVMYQTLKFVKDDLVIDQKFTKPGIVIDVGRRTTDISYVNDLVSVDGGSVSLTWATENIFNNIVEQLHDQYGMNVNTSIVEKHIFDNENFVYSGKEINIEKLLKNAVISISSHISNEFENKYANFYPTWVILTGGGSVFFKPLFEKMFGDILIVLKENIFSNALGMIKMLKKYK